MCFYIIDMKLFLLFLSVFAIFQEQHQELMQEFLGVPLLFHSLMAQISDYCMILHLIQDSMRPIIKSIQHKAPPSATEALISANKFADKLNIEGAKDLGKQIKEMMDLKVLQHESITKKKHWYNFLSVIQTKRMCPAYDKLFEFENLLQSKGIVETTTKEEIKEIKVQIKHLDMFRRLWLWLKLHKNSSKEKKAQVLFNHMANVYPDLIKFRHQNPNILNRNFWINSRPIYYYFNEPHLVHFDVLLKEFGVL